MKPLYLLLKNIETDEIHILKRISGGTISGNLKSITKFEILTNINTKTYRRIKRKINGYGDRRNATIFRKRDLFSAEDESARLAFEQLFEDSAHILTI